MKNGIEGGASSHQELTLSPSLIEENFQLPTLNQSSDEQWIGELYIEQLSPTHFLRIQATANLRDVNAQTKIRDGICAVLAEVTVGLRTGLKNRIGSFIFYWKDDHISLGDRQMSTSQYGLSGSAVFNRALEVIQKLKGVEFFGNVEKPLRLTTKNVAVVRWAEHNHFDYYSPEDRQIIATAVPYSGGQVPAEAKWLLIRPDYIVNAESYTKGRHPAYIIRATDLNSPDIDITEQISLRKKGHPFVLERPLFLTE